jgi:hypothetical protein
MKASKSSSENLKKLFGEEPNKNEEKLLVEALKNRLNELILNKPENSRKAAQILSLWINKKSKK